jgi:hypothetical protein
MMSEWRAAGVRGALLERARRARRDAIAFQRRDEGGTAYLLMWVLGLPPGMILLWPPDSPAMVSGVLGLMVGLPLAAILLCRLAPLAGVPPND